MANFFYYKVGSLTEYSKQLFCYIMHIIWERASWDSQIFGWMAEKYIESYIHDELK